MKPEKKLKTCKRCICVVKLAGSHPEKGESDLAARFLKIYANLPIEERSQVVVVIDDEPISWEVSRNEIVHSTPRGKAILSKLKKLDII